MAADNSDVLAKIDSLWRFLESDLLSRNRLKDVIREALKDSSVINEIRSKIGN